MTYDPDDFFVYVNSQRQREQREPFNVNARWYYDAPDPSVGIFGGGWLHECGSEQEPNDEVISKRVVNVWPAPMPGEDPVTEVEFTHQLTCECGATHIVADRDIC